VIDMSGRPAPPSTDAAFEDAYRSSGTAVLGYALRRAETREDALDVVAETFTTAWRRRADLPVDPEEVRPWLFGIARRCLANATRSTHRATRLGERLAAALPGTDVPDPARLHEHSVIRQQVGEALQQLSAEDRELVTLIAWEGLTPAQAAAALGLTPGATRVRLHRARTRLRAALDTPAHTQETDRAH
jgi:RNA polymerase sigma factor (sigma-70 family)